VKLHAVVDVTHRESDTKYGTGAVVAVIKKDGRTWVRVRIADSSFEVPACVVTPRTKFSPTENAPAFIVRRTRNAALDPNPQLSDYAGRGTRGPKGKLGWTTGGPDGEGTRHAMPDFTKKARKN